MDHLLKRIQQVRPAASFCSCDFLLLHNNAPAHKAASVCQFLTQKMLQPFITSPRTLQIYLHQTIFCSPNLTMKLKGLHFMDDAEIQEAITEELKKVEKEEFSAAFQKLYNCTKACIYANEAYFEFKKKICVFRMCLWFLEK